jgi:hypothetical protein
MHGPGDDGNLAWSNPFSRRRPHPAFFLARRPARPRLPVIMEHPWMAMTGLGGPPAADSFPHPPGPPARASWRPAGALTGMPRRRPATAGGGLSPRMGGRSNFAPGTRGRESGARRGSADGPVGEPAVPGGGFRDDTRGREPMAVSDRRSGIPHDTRGRGLGAVAGRHGRERGAAELTKLTRSARARRGGDARPGRPAGAPDHPRPCAGPAACRCRGWTAPPRPARRPGDG